MERSEIKTLELYLRSKFNNPRFSIAARSNKADSVDVMLGEEFIGVIFKDDEDEDTSYDFHMTILDIDLPDG